MYLIHIVNSLKLFYLIHVIVIKTLSKSSWLISYYPVDVNINQNLIIFMVANDKIWLMLYYPANVNIIQILTLSVTYICMFSYNIFFKSINL